MIWFSRHFPFVIARLPSSVLVISLLVGLSGCAMPVQGVERHADVMIGLPAGVVADDPAWVARLAAAANTPIGFTVAIGPQWAAYRLQCTPADADCEQAVMRLRQSGIVSAVEYDKRKSVRPLSR